MNKIEIAGHSLNIAAIIGVLGFAWPLLSEAMEYKETIEKAAQTAQQNSVTLDKVVVQNIEKSKDIEHIAKQQDEIKALLERILLQERNQ